MTQVFSWLQATTVIYALTAVICPAGTLGSLIIPWWLWGGILGICYLVNVVVVPWLPKLLHFFGLQFFFLSLAELSLFGYYHLAGVQVWPGVLPGSLEIPLVWSAVSYLVLKPLEAGHRVRLWEASIACTSLMLYFDRTYQLNVPWLVFAPFLVIALGLVSESRLKSGRSFISLLTYNLKFTILLAFSGTAAGALLLWGLSALQIGSFFADLQGKIALWLGSFLALFERADLDRGVKTGNLLTNIQDSPGTVNVPTWGGNAPLWFMRILWGLLGLSVFGVVGYLIIRLREVLVYLRNAEISAAPDQGQFRKLKGRLRLKIKAFFDWLRTTLGWLRVWLKQALGLKPATTPDLYLYFLWWAGRRGFKRFKYETAREYWRRISAAEEIKELSCELWQLTEAYNLERYGKEKQALDERGIRALYLKMQKSSSRSGEKQ